MSQGMFRKMFLGAAMMFFWLLLGCSGKAAESITAGDFTPNETPAPPSTITPPPSTITAPPNPDKPLPEILVSPEVSKPEEVDLKKIIYKPFARKHGDKFSLGDFDSPYLVWVSAVYADFVVSNSNVFLNETPQRVAKTNYQGSTYLGIAGFGFIDYANLANDTSDLTIRIELIRADRSVVAVETLVGLEVTKAHEIHTWMDLQGMKHNLNGEYELLDDIAFPSADREGLAPWGFEPVGSSNDQFTGSFAGNRHRIANLFISRDEAMDENDLMESPQSSQSPTPAGPTGPTGPAAGGDTNEEFLAGLEGMGFLILNDDVRPLDRCLDVDNLDDDLVASGEDYKSFVGIWGAVGDANSVIKDFIVDHVGIRGKNSVGAVVGWLQHGMVSNVGMVSSRNMRVAGNNKLGGLVGRNGGKVIGYTTGEVAGNNQTGGLVGVNDLTGTVMGYTTGKISGNNRVGGLVGENSAGCGSDSVVSGTVVGYVTGKVEGRHDVGGLVGHNELNGKVIGYSSGIVDGDSNTGGFLGYLGNGSPYLNGYWDQKKSRQSVYGHAIKDPENPELLDARDDDDHRGVGISGISTIAHVVFNSKDNTYTDTRGTKDDIDDVPAFNNNPAAFMKENPEDSVPAFVDYFTFPGADGTWPTLNVASSFLQP